MTRLRDDHSGQALLTFGFLFAITITIIALMLNNLIYTNNQAYIGFMGQSRYNDQSLRSATVSQVVSAYEDTRGNPAQFASRMEDYVDQVNNATMTRGKYIEFTPVTVNPMPASGPDVTYLATVSQLTIYGQDYKKSYTIETNYTYHAIAPLPTIAPVPAAAPASTIVRIGSNRTEVCANGNDYALIVIEVTDAATGMPASYVQVDLHVDSGELHELEGSLPVSSLVTDVNGKALARYYTLVTGTAIVNASVGPAPSFAGKNLSRNVSISCTNAATGTCGHTVIIGDAIKAYSSKVKSKTTFHTITLTIPVTVPAGTYDFEDFEATASIVELTNLQLLSVGDIDDLQVNNLQGPSDYTGYVTVKLNWINYPSPYSARIDTKVTAYCDTDDGPFASSRVITVNGPPP